MLLQIVWNTCWDQRTYNLQRPSERLQSYSCTRTPSDTRERERQYRGEGEMLRQDHKNRAMCCRDNKVPLLSTYNSTKSNVIKSDPPQSRRATNKTSCRNASDHAWSRTGMHACVFVGSCLGALCFTCSVHYILLFAPGVHAFECKDSF